VPKDERPNDERVQPDRARPGGSQPGSPGRGQQGQSQQGQSQPRRDRPRQERAQATQAAIIQAAATVFAERGYARTTLDGVAVEAGVTKGALYFHFASKHDLANAVIREETQLTNERSRQVLAEGRSGLATMIRLHADFTGQLISDVVVAAGVKLTTEELVAQLDIERPYLSWEDVLHVLIDKAIEEGDLRPDIDPAILTRYLVGAYTGVQIVSNSLTGRDDLFERVRQMWQIVLPALVPADRLEACRKLPELIRP
jgi:AcrR family transcriptional regulator